VAAAGLGAQRVLVLADDLIWADRLASSVTAAGAEAVRTREDRRFDSELTTGPRAAIVDLTARSYDGIDAVRRASSAGGPTRAVGPHDDHDHRKRALSAGAVRGLADRKLADDGPATIRAFLVRTTPARP
jgi:DNA-binding response OmpR family regulator